MTKKKQTDALIQTLKDAGFDAADFTRPERIVNTPIWSCKIGCRGDVKLPGGSDALMRRAVLEAFKKLTGADAEFVFSGWGGELTEYEWEVVNDD